MRFPGGSAFLTLLSWHFLFIYSKASPTHIKINTSYCKDTHSFLCLSHMAKRQSEKQMPNAVWDLSHYVWENKHCLVFCYYIFAKGKGNSWVTCLHKLPQCHHLVHKSPWIMNLPWTPAEPSPPTPCHRSAPHDIHTHTHTCTRRPIHLWKLHICKAISASPCGVVAAAWIITPRRTWLHLAADFPLTNLMTVGNLL